MAAALTPELALAYVRELSADVREGVVLDAAGRVLAGSPELADAAMAGGSAAGAAPLLAVATGGLRMAVRCGPHAIESIVRMDMLTALARVNSAQ